MAQGGSGVVSGTDDVDDAAVARLVVMNAYGEIMLRFQLLEMSYWRILASRLKRGVSFDQGMAKLEGWERQTGERLINVLDLPDDLPDEAMTAVNTRNYSISRTGSSEIGPRSSVIRAPATTRPDPVGSRHA